MELFVSVLDSSRFSAARRRAQRAARAVWVERVESSHRTLFASPSCCTALSSSRGAEGSSRSSNGPPLRRCRPCCPPRCRAHRARSLLLHHTSFRCSTSLLVTSFTQSLSSFSHLIQVLVSFFNLSYYSRLITLKSIPSMFLCFTKEIS